MTVFPQRKHFQDLADRLRAKGYDVPLVDFDIGNGPLDRFIDIPPFAFQVAESKRALWVAEDHLKLAVDGVASTCYGIIVRKPA